ncbi:hypothetical protein Dfri01_55720 [Dyadobacter frigoris]|nr:hypothetical protein Dfri01_55720 [Dyadobacter frigoris]
MLVCTDDFFTVDGVEKILSTEFDRQLAELGAVRHKINPVVLVYIDDLIAMQQTTSSGNKKIKDIIDLYHQRKLKRQKRAPRNIYDLLRRYQSFRSVVGNELINGPNHLVDRLVEALRLEE